MGIKTVKHPLHIRNGRAQLVSGPDAIKQTVMLAVSPSDNTNPFQQDLGTGYDLVFNDETKLGVFEGRLERIMARLETQDIARMDHGRELQSVKLSENEYGVRISYIDLETDSPDVIVVPPVRGN